MVLNFPPKNKKMLTTDELLITLGSSVGSDFNSSSRKITKIFGLKTRYNLRFTGLLCRSKVNLWSCNNRKTGLHPQLPLLMHSTDLSSPCGSPLDPPYLTIWPKSGSIASTQDVQFSSRLHSKGGLAMLVLFDPFVSAP